MQIRIGLNNMMAIMALGITLMVQPRICLHEPVKVLLISLLFL